MKKILAVLAVLCLVGSVEANPIRSRTVIRQRTVVRGGGARFSSFQSSVAVGGFSRSRFVSSSFVGSYGVQANFIQSAAYVQPAFVQSAVYVQPAVVQQVVVPQVSYVSAVMAQPQVVAVQAQAVQVQAVCPSCVQSALLPAAVPFVSSYATGCGLGSVSGSAVRVRIR